MFEVAELKCSKANQRTTAISGGGGEDDDKEDEVNYERRGSSGRRVHVIFVINVISSAVLLISCGFVRGVTAQQGNPEQQQQQQFKLPATTVPVQLTSSQLLGSLQPDQEAYVFTSSFDTERDRSECWFGWRWSICAETGFLLLSHS